MERYSINNRKSENGEENGTATDGDYSHDDKKEMIKEEREDAAEEEEESESIERIFENKEVPSWKSQLTVRAFVVSFFLSVMFTFIVMKLNLTTGIIPSLNVSAGLLGFFFVKTWTKFLEKSGLLRQPFTRQENTVIQTCVVAASGIAFSGGFGSYLFGMSEKIAKQSTEADDARNTKNPAVGWMIGFLFIVSFLGLFSVVPLRKIMILNFKLIYPSGTATAYLINSFHTPQGAKLAKKQVRALGKFFSFSFLWSFFQWFYTAGDNCGFSSFPTFGLKAFENRFYFDFSATYVGVGMICPHLINVSLLLGAILSWGIMWPLIYNQRGHWWQPADLSQSSLRGLQGYRIFIGIAMILGDGHDIPAASERDISCYLPLRRAIQQGNWENAKNFFENDPNAITARLTALSETPLLVAVKEKQGILFVRKLLELMPGEALALTDYFGNTALHAVAVLGNIIEAELIVERNPDLPDIWNSDGFLPVHLAAMHGQRKMTLFLLSVTRDDEESRPYEGEAGATLMRFAIDVGFYDVALSLLDSNPELAWNDFSPLEVMAQEHSAFPSGTCFNIWKCFIYTCVPLKSIDPNQGNDQSQVPHHRRCCVPIFGVWQKFLVVLWKVLETSVPPINRIGQTKLMHHQAIQLVKRICREVIVLDNATASSIVRLPFLLAAQYGIHEIVKEILDSFPDAITFRDEENHTAFHLAVMYRHEKVFKVMYQRSGQYKLLLSLLLDNDRNNMLHLVGYKARQQRLDFSSGGVLQMQRELQWFKVVEKFVLPQERKSKNCDGKTPLQIFIQEHKELMAYEGQWMMGMATSCTVAASLIATVVFAAAITVPGGSTVDGFPIFSKKKAFIVFAISDGLALVSALSTVLSFLSIFTSRYAVIDYLYALPMRLIIGLLALFLSVITMMTAFSATLYLVFSKENAFILIPIATLACLPVALFATLQLPPLLNMIKSTYGPSIFNQ